jgi:hypothetical protein
MKLIKVFIYIFILCSQLMLTSVVYAEQDYKCYATASDGNAYMLGLFANSADEATKTAYKMKVYNKKWKKKFIVKYISECITIPEVFKTPQARKLDSQTEM